MDPLMLQSTWIPTVMPIEQCSWLQIFCESKELFWMNQPSSWYTNIMAATSQFEPAIFCILWQQPGSILWRKCVLVIQEWLYVAIKQPLAAVQQLLLHIAMPLHQLVKCAAPRSAALRWTKCRKVAPCAGAGAIVAVQSGGVATCWTSVISGKALCNLINVAQYATNIFNELALLLQQ